MKSLLRKKNNEGENSIKLRWPYGCLLYLIILSACNTQGHAPEATDEISVSTTETKKVERAWASIYRLKDSIRTGDLVTRTGNDFTSQSLRTLNQRDKTYSHCGIASIENDTVFIYHALGGEFNPDQKIKRDRWEDFAEPYSNRGVGIYRFNIQKTQIDSVIVTIQKHIDEQVTFDMDFNLATDDKMYCAEFVAKTYSTGSQGALKFPGSRLKDFEYIGVDDLYLHPRCVSISAAVYK